MKLGVVGSRSWTDRGKVWEEIEKFYGSRNVHKENLTIVSGGADGPDTFAEQWAIKNRVSRIIHTPKWSLEGQFIASRNRNKLIVDSSAYILCFWDGKSGGCINTVDIAKDQKKLVQLVMK